MCNCHGGSASLHPRLGTVAPDGARVATACGHAKASICETECWASEWGRFFCFSRFAVKQKNRPRVAVKQKNRPRVAGRPVAPSFRRGLGEADWGRPLPAGIVGRGDAEGFLEGAGEVGRVAVATQGGHIIDVEFGVFVEEIAGATHAQALHKGR